jgi:hypothetical protein
MGHWIRTTVRRIHVSAACQAVVHVLCRRLGNGGPGQSPFLQPTSVAAHSPTTPDTRRNAICTNVMYINITQAWDGVSSILATVLSVSFSLLSYKLFLDIRFVCLLASVLLFPLSLSLHATAGLGLFFWVASLGGLHVGHFKTDTASRLRGGSLDRFCLMSLRTVATSSLSMACHLMIRRSHVLAPQTGIDCQPDLLRAAAKVIRTSGMSL